MKIKQVEIENFLAIGKITANLDNRGLVLIEGQNADDTSQNSNGSGKSSFADAISWCLFGETARGLTGDAVVNDSAGKQCRVAVTIEDGSQSYTVARHRKHKTGKNSLTLVNGEGSDLTKGTDKLTQPLVDRVVGCSADVFNAAIYSGQEQMPDLPGMTDKFLKQIVEEAAGINEVAAAHEIAKIRLRDAKNDHGAKKAEYDNQMSALAALRENLVTQEESATNWGIYQANKLKDMELEANKANDEARKRALMIDSILEEQDKLNAAKKQINARIDGVKGENERLSVLEKEAAKMEAEWNGANRHWDAIRLAILAARKELEATDDDVGKPCGSCGKPYCLEDLAEIRQIRDEKVASLESRFAAQTIECDSLDERRALARSEVDHHKSGMTDISESLAKRDKIEKAIADRQQKLDAISALVALASKLDMDCITEKNVVNPYVSQVEAAKKNISDREAKAGVTQAQGEELAADVAVKTAVANVLSPAGVRAHILDTVTPFLNARTARYLSALTDGNVTAIWSTISLTAKGEARERFAIDVVSAVGAKEFRGLSGGEKRKVRLATSMALQDLVASRATKPIDLYIADEIDDALDDSGLERLMGILDEKARERGTVLIISHNSLSDWISNSVVVKKEGGKSTMIGSAL